uniref:Uncharacterized protein n=1 Tax=Pararge aegeria TaxID=116150 RepID=S4PAX0_9NEOP
MPSNDRSFQDSVIAAKRWFIYLKVSINVSRPGVVTSWVITKKLLRLRADIRAFTHGNIFSRQVGGPEVGSRRRSCVYHVTIQNYLRSQRDILQSGRLYRALCTWQNRSRFTVLL